MTYFSESIFVNGMEVKTASHLEHQASNKYFVSVVSSDGRYEYNKVTGEYTIGGIPMSNGRKCVDMVWVDMSSKDREELSSFIAVVREVKEIRELEYIVNDEPVATSYLCPKCGTLCYGDCEAN